MIFKDIADLIKEEFIDVELDAEQEHIKVSNADWLKVSKFLKDSETLRFDFLSCITSIDGGDEGFYVAYNLTSLRFRIISETSSLTLFIVPNSWVTPSTLIATIPAPCSEDNRALRKELPKVCP